MEGYGYGGKKLARSLHSQIHHPLGLSAIVLTLYEGIQSPICKGLFSSEKDGNIDRVRAESGRT